MPRIFHLLLAACFATLLQSRGADPAPRPNILFCIADDWSYPHVSALGDKVVRTPNMDRLAREGMVFTNAFCAAPSCTPSRAAILTGRYPHQLEQGGNLWSFLPAKHPVYPALLEEAGYFVGHTRKGWGPGNFRLGGRTRNPAGPSFRSFEQFLNAAPAGTPFSFWFGTQDPHRPYERGSGAQAGLDQGKVEVPPVWPDVPEVRNDILDYYFEVERFDRELGELLALLEKKGLRENTLVVVTSDNGMPFPRAKANLYDAGTRMPLIVSWPGQVKSGSSGAFVNLLQIAPTFLDAAGVRPPPEMALPSLLPLLKGTGTGATHVFLERERHANVRQGDLSYPMRAVRTTEFLYIRNPRPERWPAGDPEHYFSVGAYGDVDNSPTKSFILDHKDTPAGQRLFELAFARRPSEELYHLRTDPAQTNNLAADAKYSSRKAELAKMLDEWMKETGDPRVNPEADPWSSYVYVGSPVKKAEPDK